MQVERPRWGWFIKNICKLKDLDGLDSGKYMQVERPRWASVGF